MTPSSSNQPRFRQGKHTLDLSRLNSVTASKPAQFQTPTNAVIAHMNGKNTNELFSTSAFLTLAHM